MISSLISLNTVHLDINMVWLVNVWKIYNINRFSKGAPHPPTTETKQWDTLFFFFFQLEPEMPGKNSLTSAT